MQIFQHFGYHCKTLSEALVGVGIASQRGNIGKGLAIGFQARRAMPHLRLCIIVDCMRQSIVSALDKRYVVHRENNAAEVFHTTKIPQCVAARR
jgi:hypothetical protein